MRWRHLRSGELDHELLWLAVSVCTAIVGGGILSSGMPTPGCIWHHLTGFPCPGCGSTRAARHLLDGHFNAALNTNPLIVLGLAAVLFFDVYAACALLFRLPRLRFDEVPRWVGTVVRVGICATLLANWAWLIARRI